MKMDRERLSGAEWTVKLRDHEELTVAEKAQLADFMCESPTHVRELIEHTFLNEDLKTLRIPQSDLDRWSAEARSTVTRANVIALTSSGNGEECAERKADVPSAQRVGEAGTTGRRRRVLVAAALAAIIVVGVAFLHSQMGVYSTGFGEQRILTLADGSVVTLNTESQIRVEFSAQNRVIELKKGEAFFRVAHDTRRPFWVDAKNAMVRAVGTQFNIRIAPQDTVVSVIDGVVKVSVSTNRSSAFRAVPANAGSQGGSQPISHDLSQITLSKGQEARIEQHEPANGSSVGPISETETPAALHAAGWTQGRLEFDGTPLVQVLSEFQRYRQFDVEFDDDTTRQLRLTGSFESHDSDSALAYIASIPGIAVDKNGSHSYFIHHR